MLVLSRKTEESVLIGSNIEITVLSVANGRVKLGIRAPKNVRVLRGELQVDCELPQRPSSRSCGIVASQFAGERKGKRDHRKSNPRHGAQRSVVTCCQ